MLSKELKKISKSIVAIDEVNEVDLDQVGIYLVGQVEPIIKDLESDWEGYSDNIEKVESQSRDGFIPLTEGGAQGSFYVDLSSLEGSGNLSSLPEKAVKSLNKILENGYSYVAKDFYKDHKEEIDNLGLTIDDVDYHSLYEAGAGELAESLSNIEYEFFSDDTIILGVEIYLYHPDNSGNPNKGKYSCYAYSYVNWEAPYHRHIDQFEWVGPEHIFTFSSVEDFQKKIKPVLNKLKSELS
jgi:hypothetical protein